jgi:hypothetical protein
MATQEDLWIIIPASPWGGRTGVVGPMGQEEADRLLAIYLKIFLPECPPKLLRVVRDYAAREDSGMVSEGNGSVPSGSP